MNAIAPIEAEPIDAVEHFGKLIAELEERLAPITDEIAELSAPVPLTAGPSSLEAAIAARRVSAARLGELQMEAGVIGERLETFRVALVKAKEVKAGQVKAEAREAALTEGMAALAKVTAAREAYLGAVQALGEIALASARRGAKFGFIPELHFAVQEEAGQLGLVQVALFNTANA